MDDFERLMAMGILPEDSGTGRDDPKVSKRRATPSEPSRGLVGRLRAWLSGIRDEAGEKPTVRNR